MVKKKEDKKNKPSQKTTKSKVIYDVIDVDMFSISELLEKNKIKPINAAGFLNHYGLTEQFMREVENNEQIIKFSESEFSDMYERYLERKI